MARAARHGVLLGAAGLIAGCIAGSAEPPPPPEPDSVAVVQPVIEPVPPAVSTVAPAPAPAPAMQGPTTFVFTGELTQGGWIRGQAPAGALSARLDGTPIALDANGHFFAAFDRDAGSTATLVAVLSDGRQLESPVVVAPREWQIERVNVALRPSGATEAFMRVRRPELERIAAARALDSGSEGWRQDFVWPATGRISGRFGSQRIYRGEPGSYHSGIDIAGPTGTPFMAPADGVVVLATEEPFTLEGHLLIIDHGMGLNSAFLHSSQLDVREGQAVRQGQLIGRIGATGRATGPHLHWGITWNGARLDPLLFTGPMN